MRTSASHPLQIAEVSAGPGRGKVGLTFCPGKYDPQAASGAWNRDLASDLDAIRDWGAAAVVTLVESRELASLRVNDLGDEVRRRQMIWYHLPIVDVSTPDQSFEVAWTSAGEELRTILRSGFDVLVHCRGGLGRAGTIAARLLAELGMEPALAVKQVRKARPGAIETPTQKQYVLSVRSTQEPVPEPDANRDRAIGSLVGLAIGDAVGTLPDGAFGLKQGECSDDTDMALCLADSLIATAGEFDPADLMNNKVANSLNRSGPLMRLAPVAIKYWNDPDKLKDIAMRQTTHAAAEAADACARYAAILADAIAGLPRSEVLRPRAEASYAGPIQSIASGDWRGKSRDQIGNLEDVAHSLEAALRCVGSTIDFKSAVLKASNLGGDANTMTAMTGQLAGALYGSKGIPAEWLIQLAGRDQIVARATTLFEQAVSPNRCSSLDH